jgi:RNA polymerase sigma factor (sigma-70 family)
MEFGAVVYPGPGRGGQMTTQPSVVNNATTHDNLWADDAKLIEKCLRGEEPAWTELVSKYKNLIFSVPIKWGLSREESADIFQSVCLDLLCELKRLREPKALAGWLIRIAYNKCFHQEQLKRRRATENGQMELVSAVEEIPDSRLDELQREEALRIALRSLNPRCHKLVDMLFFESPARPYDEIAKSLTLATGSIGAIRRRCLDELRKTLEEAGFP